MVSKMFMADYKRMKSEGIDLSPEDVIRLNALAIKAKCGGAPLHPLHLRRVLFLGDVPLHEPTIGHDLWLERVGEFFDLKTRRNFRICMCYALAAKDARTLPDPIFPRRVVRKMFRWARRHVAMFVSAAVDDALDYLLFGDDWTVGEFAPEKEKDESRTVAMQSCSVGMMAGCVARRLPLTLAEMQGRTCAELNAFISRADILDGRSDGSEARNDALGDYYSARNEIIARWKSGAKSKEKQGESDGQESSRGDNGKFDGQRQPVKSGGTDGGAAQPSTTPGETVQGGRTV